MAITFPLSIVRRSSLDSESFSPMPFRKMPFQTRKIEIKKKLMTPNRQYIICFAENRSKYTRHGNTIQLDGFLGDIFISGQPKIDFSIGNKVDLMMLKLACVVPYAQAGTSYHAPVIVS